VALPPSKALVSDIVEANRSALFQALIGVYYTYTECEGFAICFKCYRSRRIVHPDHEFDPCNEDDHASGESDQESDHEGETDNESGDMEEYEDCESAVSDEGERE
jgi:hypothetical protein